MGEGVYTAKVALVGDDGACASVVVLKYFETGFLFQSEDSENKRN